MTKFCAIVSAPTKEENMLARVKVLAALVALIAASAAPTARSQEGEGAGPPSGRTPSASPEAKKLLAPPDQVVAVRAGRMFDARSGKLLANQLILVRGD